MGDFADSPKWKLINDFTIHEDKLLSSGRPFMRTCVPKTIDVDVTSFEIIRFVEWPSNYGAEKPDAYTDSSYIKFSGDLHHTVIVFSMGGGEIASYRTVTDATIRPLSPGQIGGKNKATVYDGIGLSGMSSQEVPERGLMEGEPGALTFLSAYEESDGEKCDASLTASLFLDEDKFSRLMAAISINPRPPKSVTLGILAELFESEVSASLSEPWMSVDYGLLMKGSSIARTNARLEYIAVSTGNMKFVADDGDEDPSVIDENPSVIDKVLEIGAEEKVGVPDSGKTLLKYQRYTFLALLVLILITFFSR